MYFIVALSFALGSSALAPRACTFGLVASGGQTGTIGQLDDGQNRIGGGLSPAKYTIDNGKITDANGRGCILTPPTTQFQCDSGASPTPGFSIGADGKLTYNGKSTFYACPATETAYNLYTTPVAGQTKCVEVSLTASGCYDQPSPMSVRASTVTKVVTSTQEEIVATVYKTVDDCSLQSTLGYSTDAKTMSKSAPTSEVVKVPSTTSSKASSSAPPSSVAPSSKTPTYVAPPGTCVPTTVSGKPDNSNYQYPHLMIPVDSSKPNDAHGATYYGKITGALSTFYNFDIPASYAGKTCSLVFLLPLQSQLETASYTLFGSGNVDFSVASGAVTAGTTYATMPDVSSSLGQFTLTKGSSTLVKSFACPASSTVTYKLTALDSTDFIYFQDWNPHALGLYITAC